MLKFMVRFEEFFMGVASDITYLYELSGDQFIVYSWSNNAEEWEQFSTMTTQMILDMLISTDLGIMEVKAL